MGDKERIEEILESHRRPVSIIETREAPQVIRYRVIPKHFTLANGGKGVRTRITHLRSLSSDLAAELGVPSVKVSPGKDGLWLEISRKGGPQTVLARDIFFKGGRYKIPLVLGEDVRGDPAVVFLDDPSTPMVLVAGTTGSGKSMILHGAVLGLIKHTHPEEVKIVVVDTHSGVTSCTGSLSQGDGLGIWEGAPHVEQVVTSSGDALLALQAGLNLIDRRYASGTVWRTRWVFVIDELADILLCKTYGEEIHRVLVEILASGRKAGVHVVAATQRPSADVTKGILKANFPCRIGMAVASKVDSRVAIGEAGAEKLGGKGDGILKIGMETVRFQGGLVEDSDVEMVREWGSLWREKKGETGDNPKRGSPMKLDWLDEMKRLAEKGQREVERWKS